MQPRGKALLCVVSIFQKTWEIPKSQSTNKTFKKKLPQHPSTPPHQQTPTISAVYAITHSPRYIHHTQSSVDRLGAFQTPLLLLPPPPYLSVLHRTTFVITTSKHLHNINQSSLLKMAYACSWKSVNYMHYGLHETHATPPLTEMWEAGCWRTILTHLTFFQLWCVQLRERMPQTGHTNNVCVNERKKVFFQVANDC